MPEPSVDMGIVFRLLINLYFSFVYNKIFSLQFATVFSPHEHQSFHFIRMFGLINHQPRRVKKKRRKKRVECWDVHFSKWHAVL